MILNYSSMPISAEQWRASVGGNNAARSHVLRKSLRQKFPRKNLLSQILSFLTTLLMGTPVTNGSMGKWEVYLSLDYLAIN